MTRRQMLGLFTISACSRPHEHASVMNAPNTLRLLAFHEHYNKFFRAYFGCPPEATDEADCRPRLGKLDAAEWRATCEAAKGTF